MPVITISRGSYSRGKEIAEKLAQKLGYKCISREALIRASEQFNIPEIKLKKALHDAPSVLDRFTYGKERYLAYIQAAILEQMVEDNTIYHGMAGHAFLPKVNHKLRIRIWSEIEDRVNEEMSREHIDNPEEARYRLLKDDDERRKWSVYITGLDPLDIRFYDLIFNVSKIHVGDIVDTIARIVQLPYLQKDSESHKRMEDACVAAQLKAAIAKDFPNAEVSANEGQIFVNVTASLSQENSISNKIKDIAHQVKGVKGVRVGVMPPVERF